MFIFITIILLIISLKWYIDINQEQHAIKRNYPIIGGLRYLLEIIGPEFRQYFFDSDDEGKPFSRNEFKSIVKMSKYLESIIPFGSKRNFEQPGYYIKNSLIPKQMGEMSVDNNEKVKTKKYKEDEHLFYRKDKLARVETEPWLLSDDDAVIIGEETENPWRVKGIIGMSGMSYGALGGNALSALSLGIGDAKGSWINTGEGGMSDYHLKGDVDIVFQIGPAWYGVCDEDSNPDWRKLEELANNRRIKAFELKLGQGAKIRGGHLPADKNTKEIAKIRGVKPHQTLNSPNRFNEFNDIPSLINFVDKIKKTTRKPVGIKVVIGDRDTLDSLLAYVKKSGKNPDFITVDGGEGGTGATYPEMADSVGLPAKSAIMIADNALKYYGLRSKIKIIASGKIFSADKIAIALAMGADLVSIARGFMITAGCIMAEKCNTNKCPVGVATTNPDLQKALVINEKRYRSTNYIIILRKGLFSLAAAAGLDSPVKFNESHVVFKDEKGRTTNLSKIKKRL